jgi:hypothetical protein
VHSEIEVGDSPGGFTVWKDGEVIDSAHFTFNERLAELDGELMAVGWSRQTGETGTDRVDFEALAVSRDGRLRTSLVGPLPDPASPFIAWWSIDEVFQSADLRTFGVRGVAAELPRDKTTTVTWTYDGKTRTYRPKITTAPR